MLFCKTRPFALKEDVPAALNITIYDTVNVEAERYLVCGSDCADDRRDVPCRSLQRI